MDEKRHDEQYDSAGHTNIRNVEDREIDKRWLDEVDDEAKREAVDCVADAARDDKRDPDELTRVRALRGKRKIGCERNADHERERAKSPGGAREDAPGTARVVNEMEAEYAENRVGNHLSRMV